MLCCRVVTRILGINVMSADQLIVEFDRALRTVFSSARSVRPIPGGSLPEVDLDATQKLHVVGLMRVNHCGEICAQALYQGQALTSRNPAIREALKGAANDETEHLAWTETRIGELGGRRSLLNPLWYLGSLSLGLVAGAFGDKWNLGRAFQSPKSGIRSHRFYHPSGHALGRDVPGPGPGASACSANYHV